jgi:hypothetical protein
MARHTVSNPASFHKFGKARRVRLKHREAAPSVAGRIFGLRIDLEESEMVAP